MPQASGQSQDFSFRRRLVDEWLPPKLSRGARRLREKRRRTPAPATTAPPEAIPVAQDDPAWAALTERTLAGLQECAPEFRPTNFWSPGVERLLREIDNMGLATFKTWPAAFFWFYPRYGKVLDPAVMRRIGNLASVRGSRRTKKWIRSALSGVPEAMRDFDVARVFWDQERWPMDLETYGESGVGMPTQTFDLAPGPARLTKPYLNYLLCLAGLSRHVDEPPKSFLELGGGFGVLGEIVMARDPEARYVNCDIPPLLTVSSYNLTEVFGPERVRVYDERIPDTGPIDVPQSACLPNWRIADLTGSYDVFVNSFSFQEMEPHVVEHYVDIVAKLGVTYVVSLNSRSGKHVAEGEEVGVKEPVVSSMIIEMFRHHGYELCATYNRPLINAAGELAILKRA